MPLYRYSSIDEKGKKVKGSINAENVRKAQDLLLNEKKFITEIHEIKQKSKEIVISSSLLLAFTRSISQLLRAGLPLYESLLSVEEKYKSHRAHSVFLDLCDHLKRGSTLSLALSKYPKIFDKIYISMVLSAESSGSLTETFERLSLLIERSSKLKKKIAGALIYPLFLGAFCLIVIAVLLLFVIPSMEDLFLGRNLMAITRSVLFTSQFLRAQAMALFIGFNLFILSFLLSFKVGFGQKVVGYLMRHLPIVKTLVLEASLVRFFYVLALLLRSDVPILDSMVIAGGQTGYNELEKEINVAKEAVAAGQSLSSSLEKAELMPRVVIRMVATFEQTGRIASGLEQIAELYEEELDRSLTQLTALLQPVLLVLLGGIVGFILLSIMLPLTDVASFLE